MGLGSGEGLTSKGRPLRSEIKDESPGKYPFDEWKMSSTRNPARRAKVARAIGAKGAEIEGASGITDAFHDARPLMPATGEVWALDDPLLASTESRYPRAREFAFAPGSVGSVENPWFSERRWTVGKGLVAAYTMDAGVGSVLRDDSGNFKSGTISGATWTDDATRGWCLDFDGSNDYVSLTGNIPLTGTSRSISVWAKSSQSTTYSYILDIQTSRVLFAWNTNTSGKIGFLDPGNWRSFGDAPNDGAWHHIVLVMDGASSEASLYIDGSALGSALRYTPVSITGGAGSIGSDYYQTGGRFDGLLDQLVIYNRVLTTAEISALYAETSPYEDIYVPPCDNAVWLGKTTTNLVRTTDLSDSTKWYINAIYHTNYGNVFDSYLQKTVWKWNKGSTANYSFLIDTPFSNVSANHILSIMVWCNYEIAVNPRMEDTGGTYLAAEAGAVVVPANTWTLVTGKVVNAGAYWEQVQWVFLNVGGRNLPADIEFRACDPYVGLESYPMPFVPTTRPAGSLWYDYEWPQQGTVGFWTIPRFGFDVGQRKYFVSDFNGAEVNIRIYYSYTTDSWAASINGSTTVEISGTPVTSNADLWKPWFIALTWDVPNDSLKLYCYNEDYPDGDNASSSSDLGTVTFEPYLSVGGIPLYTSPAGYEADSLIGGLFIDDTVWTEANLKAHYEGRRGFTLGGATSSGRGGFENSQDRVFLQDVSLGSRDSTTRIKMKAETGEVWAQGIYEKTTATGGNVYVGSDFKLIRGGVSAEKYKRDIEDLDPKVLDRVLGLRPIWYRSLCEYDNPSWSWYGLLAEEVARVDPRLVTWGRPELGPVPEGVDYARLSVMVLALIQRLSARYDHDMDALGTRVEGILAGIELLRDRVPLIEKRVNDILDRIVILEKEVEDVKARLTESSPVIVKESETK